VKILDLFSGGGFFTLAARHVWPDAETVAFVEIDPFCQDWLRANFPGVPIHPDIKEYRHDGTTIDILVGGPPCQPVSVAGKRKGDADDRWLWPEMLRIMVDVQPRWVIFENVSGLIGFNKGLLFDGILVDMEAAGFEVFPPFVLPACSQDAPHRRDRVWVVAHSRYASTARRGSGEDKALHGGQGGMGYPKHGESGDVGDTQGERSGKKGEYQPGRTPERIAESSQDGDMADAESRKSGEQTKQKGRGDFSRASQDICDPWSDSTWLIGHDGKARRVPESALRGMADGGPAEYDNENITLLVEKFKHRADFLKMLGNSIVWPVVVPIMEAIRDAE